MALARVARLAWWTLSLPSLLWLGRLEPFSVPMESEVLANAAFFS
jgi:hypothetical protein